MSAPAGRPNRRKPLPFSFGWPRGGAASSAAGGGGGARGKGDEEAPLLLDPFVKRRQDVRSAVLMGAHFPFAIFATLLTLFTFWYHRMPAAPWLVAALGANVVVVSAWPTTTSVGPSRDRWDWLPLLTGLAAIGSGIALGTLNFAIIEPWVCARFLNEYTGVQPTMNPEAALDAGILRFAQGSRLDVQSAAGFRAWPYTYCAAPVVGADNTSAGPIGFWAVGVNCCGSRGDFSCDGASDAEARAGLRVQSHPLGVPMGHEVGGNYERAVRMAAAAYGVTAAERPVLLAWHKDPQSMANGCWWIATAIFAGSVLAAFGACALCQWVLVKVVR